MFVYLAIYLRGVKAMQRLLIFTFAIVSLSLPAVAQTKSKQSGKSAKGSVQLLEALKKARKEKGGK